MINFLLNYFFRVPLVLPDFLKLFKSKNNFDQKLISKILLFSHHITKIKEF